MNATMKRGLSSGDIEVLEPPALIKVSLEYLRDLLGEDPDLGYQVAIGTRNPAVYRITMGEGLHFVDGKRATVNGVDSYSANHLCDSYVLRLVS